MLSKIPARAIFLFLVAFIFGFYTNAILMYKPSDELLELFYLGRNTKEIATQKFADPETNIVVVTFDGNVFSPSKVTLPIGKRLEIKNGSPDTLMHLTSSTEQLNTVRGYGEAERFLVVLMDEGNYTVSTLAKPNAKLDITVKKQATVEN